MLGSGFDPDDERGECAILYCEVHMLAIRLPLSVGKRLERLARRSGRSKSYYVREAILLYLGELEDIYLAERALRRIRAGKDRVIPIEKVMKRFYTES
jgi:RHH-type transcriptional regulator, rel operon repressor / antitoxin RelB